MGTPPLSQETRRRMECVFARRDWTEAERMLVEDCGNNLPFLEEADSQRLDRFRFAALKLSEGTLQGLKEAVELAKIDWRDLLMAAGFGYDIHEHERWNP